MNCKKIIYRFVIFFIFLVLIINSVYSTDTITNTTLNISEKNKLGLELFSNKSMYNVGENIDLFLKINNTYNNSFIGKLRGKVIIGDVGYNIQCYEINIPSNQSIVIQLPSIPATLSNSNRKAMTEIYACDGTNFRSNKIEMSNTPITQTGTEAYTIKPFIISYTLNDTDYETKSNSLKITVTASSTNNQPQQTTQTSPNNNNQNANRNSNQNSNSNNYNGNSNQNNNNNIQSQRLQNNLMNNQENSQTINQIKKEIAKSKYNPKNIINNVEKNNKFNLWLLIILLVLMGFIFYYYIRYKEKESYKEYNKEDLVNENIIKEPKCIILLNKIKDIDDKKEKAVLLSKSIRDYILNKEKKENLKINDLTHAEAIELTNDSYLKELLKKLELIEFANAKNDLDYDKIVNELNKKFKKLKESKY